MRESVGSNCIIVAAVTLLPQPLSPTIQSVLPFSTSKETPLTALLHRLFV